MSTVIRPEVSKKNPYYISKHRHYELKHFCLQYPEWRRKILSLQNSLRVSSLRQDGVKQKSLYSDPTYDAVAKIQYYKDLINMVESSAKEASDDIYDYILKAVTEDYSYPYLQTVMEIPCSKDYYYKTCRRFWYILSQKRDSRNNHSL